MNELVLQKPITNKRKCFMERHLTPRHAKEAAPIKAKHNAAWPRMYKTITVDVPTRMGEFYEAPVMMKNSRQLMTAERWRIRLL